MLLDYQFINPDPLLALKDDLNMSSLFQFHLEEHVLFVQDIVEAHFSVSYVLCTLKSIASNCFVVVILASPGVAYLAKLCQDVFLQQTTYISHNLAIDHLILD